MTVLHPATDDTYRLFTHTLADEGYTHTYRRQHEQSHSDRQRVRIR